MDRQRYLKNVQLLSGSSRNFWHELYSRSRQTSEQHQISRPLDDMDASTTREKERRTEGFSSKEAIADRSTKPEEKAPGSKLQKFSIGYKPKNLEEARKLEAVENDIKHREEIKGIISRLDNLKSKLEHIKRLQSELDENDKAFKPGQKKVDEFEIGKDTQQQEILQREWQLKTRQAMINAQKVTACIRLNPNNIELKTQTNSIKAKEERLNADKLALKKKKLQMASKECEEERRQIENDLQAIGKLSGPLTDLDATLLEMKQSLRINPEDPVQLRAGVSAVLRNEGPIQLLTEEAHTLRVLDQAQADPEIARDFQTLLDVGDDCAHPAVAQTALAFRFTSTYASLSEQLKRESIPGHRAKNSAALTQKELYKEALKRTQDEREVIIRRPYDDLFECREEERFKPTAVSRGLTSSDNELSVKIRRGTLQPLAVFNEATRKSLQKQLSQVQVDQTERSMKDWQEQNQSERMQHYDLSGLGLLYNNEPLMGIDVMEKGHAIRNFSSRAITRNEDGHEKTYFQSRKESDSDKSYFDGIAQSCCLYLSGNQLKEKKKAVQSHLEDSYWQAKAYDWRLGNRTKYYRQIHPTMTQYARSAIETLREEQGKRQVTILDIAGGNGDLGERIIKDVHEQFEDVTVKYILVDYSQEDVQLARERFRNLRSDRVHTRAVERDMLEYEFNAEKMKKDLGLPPEGVDIVLNSGGLLNGSISGDHAEPAKFNQMYASLMAPGGFGIYSGLTPLQVGPEDYQRCGLTVQNLYDFNTQRSTHVVRRPN